MRSDEFAPSMHGVGLIAGKSGTGGLKLGVQPPAEAARNFGRGTLLFRTAFNTEKRNDHLSPARPAKSRSPMGSPGRPRGESGSRSPGRVRGRASSRGCGRPHRHKVYLPSDADLAPTGTDTDPRSLSKGCFLIALRREPQRVLGWAPESQPVRQPGFRPPARPEWQPRVRPPP